MIVDPVGPDVPPGLAPLLTSMRDAIMELFTPTEPRAVFPTLEASLPPASDWPSTVVLVTDLNVLAHSDGSDWIRADTGAPI